MPKPRKRSVGAIKRARRRLINKALKLCQLHLFEDRSEAAAKALAELRDGLAAFERELRK
jgi:hypothetical protein